MAIQKSQKEFRKVRVGQNIVQVALWNCLCDGCGKTTIRSANDPGDMHPLAEKEGWRCEGNDPRRPMKWFCPACLAKKEQNGKHKPRNTGVN